MTMTTSDDPHSYNTSYAAPSFGTTGDAANGIYDSSGTSWLFDNVTATQFPTAEVTAVGWTWWEILKLLLALVGIVGNSAVILVLCRPCRKGHSTDTLIAALAVADLLTSFFITFRLIDAEVPEDPLAAQIYCKVIKSSVLMWICIYASIFTLSSISVERLLAVRYPYTVMSSLTRKRCGCVVAAIWILAIVLKVPPHFTIHFAKDGKCERDFKNDRLQLLYGISVFLIQYLIPVVVMTTAHVLTIRELRWHRRKSAVSCKRRLPSERVDRREIRLLTARRRVMQMLFLVVVTFIVCWTPDQIDFLLVNLGILHPSVLKGPVHQSFIMLAFVNSCANPFIYTARNADFRKAFKHLFVKTPEGRLQYVFGDANHRHSSRRTHSVKTLADTNLEPFGV